MCLTLQDRLSSPKISNNKPLEICWCKILYSPDTLPVVQPKLLCNLAVVTLSKPVSTIQVSANTVSVNTFGVDKMLRRTSTTLQVLCQTVCNTRDSFVNWTCGILSHIFLSVQTFIQKLFWGSDKGLKVVSCVAPKTWYSKATSYSFSITSGQYS